MRRVLYYLMLCLFLVCVALSVVSFGSVSPSVAVPMYGLIVLLILLWAARFFISDRMAWVKSPMHLPVVVFTAYSAVQCMMTSMAAHAARLELFHVVLYAFVYFLVASNFHRERDRSVIVVGLMVLAVLECAYGLWQFATKSEAVLFLQRPGAAGSAGGTYVSHNHFAGFLEIVFGLVLARIALYRLSSASQIEHLVHKLIEGYVAVIIAATLIASLSRGAWVAVSISLVVFWVWVWGRKPLTLRGLVVTVSLLATLGLIAWSFSPVRERLVKSAQSRMAIAIETHPTGMPVGVGDKTFSGRIAMWKASLQMINNHPLFGIGPGAWEWVHLKYRNPSLQMRPKYAHSDVLQLTAEYGVVGLGIVVWALVCFFCEAIRLSHPSRTPSQRAVAVGSGIAVTAMLVHSCFDFNMHIPANALLVVTLMGLTVAARDREELGRRVTLVRRTRVGIATALIMMASVTGWWGGRMAWADYCLSRGNDAREMLEWDRALTLYLSAIAWNSQLSEPHARIGDVYRTQASFQPSASSVRNRLAQQAVDAYRNALRLNPSDSQVLLRLAAVQELAGMMEEARRTYQQAVTADPKSAFVYLRMGVFYRHMGENQRAIEAFKQCQRLGAADSTAQLNLQELRR